MLAVVTVYSHPVIKNINTSIKSIETEHMHADIERIIMFTKNIKENSTVPNVES